MGDFALLWDPLLGSADLLVDAVADDLESEEGLRTAVLLSLYTDRRANNDDTLPGDDSDRRGWLGDELMPDPDDRIGSRLWLLERSKVTSDMRADAENYIREALQWMIDDGVVLEVGVTTELVSGS